MGNLFVDEEKEKYYYSYQKEYICVKCSAPFNGGIGSYSRRTSCRIHNYIDGKCTDCYNTNKHIHNSCCYHIKKPQPWWKRCFS